MKYRPSNTRVGVTFISFLLIVGTLLPAQSRASVLGGFIAAIRGGDTQAKSEVSTGSNLQIMSLPKPAMNANPMAGKGGGDIKIVDDKALMSEEGPSGTIADIEKPKNSTVSVYVVRAGDTLSEIGELFGVPTDTILWANNLTRSSKIQIGQKLTILPIPGVKHTVKKGDTLASVAKQYQADVVEIANYNGIEDGILAVGAEIIIPNGEIQAPPPVKTGKTVTAAVKYGVAATIGDYMAPLARYVETQGIHGYNGVDLGAPAGTPIMASAGGEVIVAKSGGYNGGYGNYVVIQHANGSQTLYAHMSKVSIYSGAMVAQGQVIGTVGSTGRSTGAHLHFEIRNGIRNPF
ncbi:hypothetical protein COU18_00350 [Candidatus Kaiserbacteria bacterium CG10_big_fil_rev_8_21_14_0_10_51_14]|uniref:LysM domain-containing protein n=1 Tax=Candidatus Kaiserbacteria bacterium CG10_big_fil_rev_8_21_14_0_10_51_14 TaxID=1974610 RepID=A0A2H0UCR9_9BACT|nr:MAG: hypothetical protein COU18_00350 [Candidatus Kaiserbacteria bacterium CG10_big_fil_rev_8_21_14_0_10_51_14]